MDNTGSHSSPVPSPRGFRKILSRAKRPSNVPKSESGTDLTLRSSISSAGDRNSEESSQVDSSKSESSGLRKLIPGRSKREKRRKDSEIQKQAEEDEAHRGRKPLKPNGQKGPGPASNSPVNQSSSSLNNDAASSLLTDDSEPDL